VGPELYTVGDVDRLYTRLRVCLHIACYNVAKDAGYAQNSIIGLIVRCVTLLTLVGDVVRLRDPPTVSYASLFGLQRT
jgi:hypothetical protein